MPELTAANTRDFWLSMGSIGILALTLFYALLRPHLLKKMSFRHQETTGKKGERK